MFRASSCTCENGICPKFCHAAASGIVGDFFAPCGFLRREVSRTSFGARARVPSLCVFECVCVCVCLCMGIAVCLVRVRLCVAVHVAVHACARACARV